MAENPAMVMHIVDGRSDPMARFDRQITLRDGPILGVYGTAVYAVLVSLADGQNPHLDYTVAEIASYLGCSIRKVQYALKDLERLGWILIRERFDAKTGLQLSNGYTLINRPAKYAPPDLESNDSKKIYIWGAHFAPPSSDASHEGETMSINLDPMDPELLDLLEQYPEANPITMESKRTRPVHIYATADGTETVGSLLPYYSVRVYPDFKRGGRLKVDGQGWIAQKDLRPPRKGGRRQRAFVVDIPKPDFEKLEDETLMVRNVVGALGVNWTHCDSLRRDRLREAARIMSEKGLQRVDVYAYYEWLADKADDEEWDGFAEPAMARYADQYLNELAASGGEEYVVIDGEKIPLAVVKQWMEDAGNGGRDQ